MTRPRLGFAGTGWIGRHRMAAMLATGLVDAVAYCEPDDAAAAEALKQAPGARRVASLDALLETAPDGVVIATPSALHAEQSIRALGAGAAVFCQKPLGRNALEVAEVLRAAEAAGRLLGVDMSYRHASAMKAVRELVRSGALGRIHAVNLVFHNAYGPDKPWFFDPALSGGGCLIDLGIHLVDLALWTLSFPEVEGATCRLSAKGRPLLPGGVEDHAVALLDLEGGTTVQLACSWHLSAGQDAVIAAEFYGDRGAAVLRNLRGSFYDFTAHRFDGTDSRCLAEPPDEWGGRAAAHWARAVAQGASFSGTTSGLLAASRTIDRLYEAGGAARSIPPLPSRPAAFHSLWAT
ncbi:MAG: hypothetical protein QOH81_1639 [Sphingomonadales bacterium]|jgi:predicted dehydrogenase|nr:hypothetical protein [Sphingomonadales bacterium]